MNIVTILAPYAALLTLQYLGLSLYISRIRRREGVGLGDGNVEALRRAIRAHANFAEYTPMALMLLLLIVLSTNDPVGSICLLLSLYSDASSIATACWSRSLTGAIGSAPMA